MNEKKLFKTIVLVSDVTGYYRECNPHKVSYFLVIVKIYIVVKPVIEINAYEVCLEYSQYIDDCKFYAA